ncbi:hypothetical protein JCM8115_001359 [Rhodotorula mucilaginosa]
MPDTHQVRVNKTPRHLIEGCCEAFVDDIIIYSNTAEEHENKCRAVFPVLVLCNTKPCCSRKKTNLFTTRTKFLSHIISRDGLKVDPDKTDEIKKMAAILHSPNDPRATKPTLRFLADSGSFDSLYSPSSDDPSS